VTLILPHGAQRHILTYPGTISELRFEDLALSICLGSPLHMSSLFLQRQLLPHVPDLFRRMKASGLTTRSTLTTIPTPMGGHRRDPASRGHPAANEREAKKIARADDWNRTFAARTKGADRRSQMGASGAVAVRDGQRFSAPAVP